MKSIDMNADMNARIRALLNDKILNFGREELITAYEMIKLIKIPKKKLVKEKQGLDFDFDEIQSALQGITRSMADDIINIERKERL